MALPIKPFQWTSNFTQVPNEFFEIGPYLTEPELRIMLYAIRHTIGMHEKRESREAHISVRNFAFGYTKDGVQYEGTRLTEVTIRKALPELVRLGMLERIGGITESGQKWKLPQGCNASALAKRDKDRYEKDRLRTVNGRRKAEEKRHLGEGGLSHNGGYPIENQGGYPITEGGVIGYPQIEKKAKDDTKEREEIKTTSAPNVAAHVPANEWPDTQEASFYLNGEKGNSSQAEKVGMGDANDTTPPPTPPAINVAVAPVADVQPPIAATVSKKGAKVKKASGHTLEENRAIAIALGEAWGISPVGDDFGLYIKKAQKLVDNGVPVTLFKKFCDRQKEKAGTFADKLTIAGITENGRISEFHGWYAAEAEKERKQKEDEARLFEQHPHLRVYASNEPIEYATQEELRAILSSVLKPTKDVS